MESASPDQKKFTSEILEGWNGRQRSPWGRAHCERRELQPVKKKKLGCSMLVAGHFTKKNEYDEPVNKRKSEKGRGGQVSQKQAIGGEPGKKVEGFLHGNARHACG